MNKLLFSSLHVNNQSINNVFSLIKSSTDISIPVQSSLGEMVNVALTKMIAENDAFGEQINKNQKSGLTDELILLDIDRDDIENEINRDITYHIKGSDPAKKAAAEKMKLFISPYWKATKLPLNTQTGVVFDMLLKYKTIPSLIDAATALDIEDKFTLLEVRNKAFDTVYIDRNNEAPDHILSGSSLKPLAVESYSTFCSVLEQAVNLTPNDQIIALFYKLDDLRKKYHTMESPGKNVPPVDGGEK